MFFFLVHYGMFVFAQLHIFLSIMKIHNLRITIIELIFSFYKVLPAYALQYLGLFTTLYCLGILKDFIISGKYKTMLLTTQKFTPLQKNFYSKVCCNSWCVCVITKSRWKIFNSCIYSY